VGGGGGGGGWWFECVSGEEGLEWDSYLCGEKKTFDGRPWVSRGKNTGCEIKCRPWESRCLVNGVNGELLLWVFGFLADRHKIFLCVAQKIEPKFFNKILFLLSSSFKTSPTSPTFVNFYIINEQ